LLLQWNLNTCLRVKFEGVGGNESPRVRSLLVTAQLVLQVVSNIVSYAILKSFWCLGHSSNELMLSIVFQQVH